MSGPFTPFLGMVINVGSKVKLTQLIDNKTVEREQSRYDKP